MALDITVTTPSAVTIEENTPPTPIEVILDRGMSTYTGNITVNNTTTGGGVSLSADSYNALTLGSEVDPAAYYGSPNGTGTFVVANFTPANMAAAKPFTRNLTSFYMEYRNAPRMMVMHDVRVQLTMPLGDYAIEYKIDSEFVQSNAGIGGILTGVATRTVAPLTVVYATPAYAWVGGAGAPTYDNPVTSPGSMAYEGSSLTYLWNARRASYGMPTGATVGNFRTTFRDMITINNAWGTLPPVDNIVFRVATNFALITMSDPHPASTFSTV